MIKRLCLTALSWWHGAHVHAEDIPGIPVPGRIDTPEWVLDAGDADIGPSGGGSDDDWRASHAQLQWDHRWLAAAIDYSLLTSLNPSGAPIYWGNPDPFLEAHRGAGRSDEITASLALRERLSMDHWSGWAQIGPGIQFSGDFGGKSLQNNFHTFINNNHNDLDYVHSRLASGFAQAGTGVRWSMAGPISLDARAIGMLTTRGWTRWRTDALLVASRGGAGVWAGVRQDGAAGHALTTIADAVAKHESGLGVLAGLAWHVQDAELSLETSHNLDNDGQDGYISLAYEPSQSRPATRADGDQRTWQARVGLCGYDSRVPGFGTDVVVGTAMAHLPRWMLAEIGFREQDINVPYEYNFSGRRLMLWCGLGADPLLLADRHGNLAAVLEAGVGARSDRVRALGFADVDGETSSTFTTPLFRAAGGLGARMSSGGMNYGLLMLLEMVAARKRAVVLDIDETADPSIVVKHRDLPIDGSSAGLIIALSVSWGR